MGFWDKVKEFFAGPKAATPEPPARPAPPASRPRVRDPLAAAHILALSKEELRKRALQITPWKTAWIGRVDTIPPQSDERTALIDRGLVLRGLLTEAQLVEIHRIGDLWLEHHESVHLAELAARQSAAATVAQAKAARAQRKIELRAQAAARKQARAEAVARRRAEDIDFLGPGVSSGLADRRPNLERLHSLGLPVLGTAGDVAAALGVTVSRLRWLCMHNPAATRVHYVYFEVPKRSGGKRLLSAPHAGLKTAQTWVLRAILDRVALEEPAHGFVRGRSTVTNARPHLGSGVVVNLDLKDFFPTIGWRRVRGVFAHLGYSPAVATILALLATEPPRRAVVLDGQRLFVAVGERALPQGAATSPALSNLVARRLDKRLAGMARKHGWRYTRYADDMTFSATEERRGDVATLLARVRHIADEEGFALNAKKGRVLPAAARQMVTGVVVNQRLALPRDEVRRLRALLHNARKHGLESQNRDGRPNFEAHVRGRLAYLQMVDRARGQAMLAELDAIVGRPR